MKERFVYYYEQRKKAGDVIFCFYFKQKYEQLKRERNV